MRGGMENEETALRLKEKRARLDDIGLCCLLILLPHYKL